MRNRHASPRTPTSSGSCRPMATAAISAPRIGGREVNFNYLRQIAQAADQLGYFGVLLPTGRSCEDSWVVASAVAPFDRAAALSRRGAARPAIADVAARMTATLDRMSNGRLLINVVTGGDPVENKGDGIFLDHDERYEVTREFLSVYSDLLAGKTVNFEGKHIRIEDGRLLFPPVQSPRPPLYFGGSSDAGIDVAVDTVDKYLTWGEPPAQVAEKVARVKARRRGARPQAVLRHPPACDRARDQRGGLEGRRRSDQACHRRHHRHGAEDLRADGFGRPAAHGAAAWRPPRQARDQPQPLGRRRPGARRRRHRAGRRSRDRRRADQGISGRSASIPSSCPAIRIWRKPIASPSWCSRCWRSDAAGNATPLRVNTGPFGETIANEHRPQQQGVAIMSLIESLPRVRALRLPRADGLIAAWIVPLAIVVVWQVACATGFVPARVLPAPSDVARRGLEAAALRRARAQHLGQLLARRHRLRRSAAASASPSGLPTACRSSPASSPTPRCRWCATCRIWR